MKNHFEGKIGLCLDHADAHFIDITTEPATITTVHSSQESQLRTPGESGDGMSLGNNRSTNNEHQKHNREQDIMHHYYKILADRLREYDTIFLFGPTKAKDELNNILTEDQHFKLKHIKVESTDKLTENQMVAKVREHFSIPA